eukprot:4140-Karenia_brevis.AAC.1
MELQQCLCPTCMWTCCQICRSEAAQGKARTKRLSLKRKWTYANCAQKELEMANKKHKHNQVISAGTRIQDLII